MATSTFSSVWDIFDTNLSLYTIPVGWCLALAPRLYSMHIYESKSKKKVDITQPRSFVSQYSSDESLDSATKAKIIRAEAASSNGVENIAFFAAAVVAGNAAGLDSKVLNLITGAYLVTRIVYNIIYIHNETLEMARWRSHTFISGVGLIFSLFILSGNKMRK